MYLLANVVLDEGACGTDHLRIVERRPESAVHVELDRLARTESCTLSHHLRDDPREQPLELNVPHGQERMQLAAVRGAGTARLIAQGVGFEDDDFFGEVAENSSRDQSRKAPSEYYSPVHVILL
ncbi:hypothetical protein ACF1BP_22315 [Streptomyces sp. NPDC014735]|uniref:hypothetical protein n=1 Tax=Streptomyces sp. NPDC014735 TaxID=3364887 RepID=UPI0036F58B4B